MISDQYRAEFDQLGSYAVKDRIKAGIYSDPQKIKEAYEWLDEIERGPDRALMREQIEVSREAVRTSKAANTRATIALVISAIAVVGAFAAIIVPHFWK